ncbi:MAG TPA: hypothetical protein ENN80_03090 [Candidatus Hydrogenedentes bacterium]|nr:hypothetical protein [Candidatus Hydrogenedentota bacterium]
MTSDFEEMPEAPKDPTKWIWLGVLAVVAMMLALMWFFTKTPYEGQSVVRARHILIQYDPSDATDRAAALELITDLRERILAGERFSKLAREYSDDSYSRGRGGDLNYVPKGSFEENFEAYVWSAPIGQVSEVVTTSHGFHIIVVEDRHLSQADAYQERIRQKTLEDQENEEVARPETEAPDDPEVRET